MPWIIWDASESACSGMNMAVTREAVATPKLIAICWAVLAMVLALLVLGAGTSGEGQGVHAGVLQGAEETEAEGFQHDEPDGRVFTDGGEDADQHTHGDGVGHQYSTVAEASEDIGMVIFRLMAAMAWGMNRRPDCTGVKPRPTW